MQGGQHVNNVAALGVALKEATTPAFRQYAKQVIKNAITLSEELKRLGWRIISDGTDSHMFSVDVGERGIRGNDAETALERAGIVLNREEIPYDNGGEKDPSGIRIGTPAVTTRGMKEKEMKLLANLISDTLLKTVSLHNIQHAITTLTKKFPIRV